MAFYNSLEHLTQPFLLVPGNKHPIKLDRFLESAVVRLECSDTATSCSDIPHGVYMYRVCKDFVYIPDDAKRQDVYEPVDPSMCLNCKGEDAPVAVDQFVRSFNGTPIENYNPWASGMTKIILYGAVLITNQNLVDPTFPLKIDNGAVKVTRDYLASVKTPMFDIVYETIIRPLLPVIVTLSFVIMALKY